MLERLRICHLVCHAIKICNPVITIIIVPIVNITLAHIKNHVIKCLSVLECRIVILEYNLCQTLSMQLRERLSLLKEKQAEEEESKRNEILENKQAKDRLLMDTLTVISKHRAEDTRARAEQ